MRRDQRRHLWKAGVRNERKKESSGVKCHGKAVEKQEELREREEALSSANTWK